MLYSWSAADLGMFTQPCDPFVLYILPPKDLRQLASCIPQLPENLIHLLTHTCHVGPVRYFPGTRLLIAKTPVGVLLPGLPVTHGVESIGAPST